VELRVAVAEIRLADGIERLYSIENLSGELTARESSAWRNLIRVLTHEIMNTLTPVSSLAETTATMLDDPRATADVRNAIETIARRSQGLMTFVSRYRELLAVPKPVPAPLLVADVMHSVVKLTQPELTGVRVKVEVEPASLQVHADRQLLDQVVLNLVKNALDALAGRGSRWLTLSAYADFGRTIIKVADNGPGIADDAIDQIFVPFFTTKRDGSGIGLSLSRQIMSAHGGEIVVDSDAGGTTVSLIF
jgi:signal transduction histidine kinase